MYVRNVEETHPDNHKKRNKNMEDSVPPKMVPIYCSLVDVSICSAGGCWEREGEKVPAVHSWFAPPYAVH